MKLLLHRACSRKLQFLDSGFQGTRAEIYGLTFLSLLADKGKEERKRRMKGRGSDVEFRSSGLPQSLSATQKPKQKFWEETGIICHQKISGCAPQEPPAADPGLQLSWPHSRSALLRVLNLSSRGYG